jgi:multiple sugar transport system permease protein
MIIYMAALQGISKELYEASALDGAGSWKKFTGIVMPLLRPTTYFILVNMIIGSFNVFLQVLLLTHGDPNGRTSSLQYMIYDKAFSQFKFGEASAIGMITAVTILLLTVILNRGLKLDSVDKEEL